MHNEQAHVVDACTERHRRHLRRTLLRPLPGGVRRKDENEDDEHRLRSNARVAKTSSGVGRFIQRRRAGSLIEGEKGEQSLRVLGQEEDAGEQQVRREELHRDIVGEVDHHHVKESSSAGDEPKGDGTPREEEQTRDRLHDAREDLVRCGIPDEQPREAHRQQVA